MNIKAMRKKRGMTQAQVADETGIRRSRISAIETGKTEATADERLALITLFAGTDEMNGNGQETETPQPSLHIPQGIAELIMRIRNKEIPVDVGIKRLADIILR